MSHSFLLFLLVPCALCMTTLYGTITRENQTSTSGIVVQCYSIPYNPTAKTFFGLTDSIYGFSPIQQISVTTGTFKLTVDNGNYSIFLFEDTDGNGILNLKNFPEMGWYGNNDLANMLGVVTVDNSKNSEDINVGNIILKKSHPFGDKEQKGKAGGSFRKLKGFNLLHLKGSLSERGYDHGFLAGQQVIDWFRFYILERLVPPKDYLSTGVKFLTEVLNMSPDFIEEGNALIKGMQDSGINMFVPEVGRNFMLIDLFAINSYIEIGDKFSACTQFVVFGDRTTDGSVIAARNMDGEVDMRKVTVSHLTVFAVDPTNNNVINNNNNIKMGAGQQYRYVSVMWPGFVGTLTGINEAGLYAMMNTGRTADGPPVNNASPVTFALRAALENLNASTATPDATLNLLNTFKCSGGGISTSGTIFVFARDIKKADGVPGFVFEGDKYNGKMRIPGQVFPLDDNCIMASNHFFGYGADPWNPWLNFNKDVSFESRWRYTVGSETLAVFNRTQAKLDKESVISQLLQKVAHGSTEHSVIWSTKEKSFSIANANMEVSMWDAPYMPWTTFTFAEIFSQ